MFYLDRHFFQISKRMDYDSTYSSCSSLLNDSQTVDLSIESYCEIKARQCAERCAFATRLHKEKARLASQQRQQKQALKKVFDMERVALEQKLNKKWSEWSEKNKKRKASFLEQSNNNVNNKYKRSRMDYSPEHSLDSTLPDLVLEKDNEESESSSILIIDENDVSSNASILTNLKPQASNALSNFAKNSSYHLVSFSQLGKSSITIERLKPNQTFAELLDNLDYFSTPKKTFNHSV